MKLELMEFIVLQDIRRHGTLNRMYKHKIAIELCYKGILDCNELATKKVYYLTDYGREVLRCNEPYGFYGPIHFTQPIGRLKIYNDIIQKLEDELYRDL